jgi:hypothetical protein
MIQYGLEEAKAQRQENLMRLQALRDEEKMVHTEKMTNARIASQEALADKRLTSQEALADKRFAQQSELLDRRLAHQGSGAGEKKTQDQKDYEYLIGQGKSEEEAYAATFGKGGSPAAEKGDNLLGEERLRKLTSQILGDKWKEGNEIPKEKLSEINRIRAKQKLPPITEKKVEKGFWNDKYTYGTDEPEPSPQGGLSEQGTAPPDGGIDPVTEVRRIRSLPIAQQQKAFSTLMEKADEPTRAEITELVDFARLRIAGNESTLLDDITAIDDQVRESMNNNGKESIYHPEHENKRTVIITGHTNE